MSANLQDVVTGLAVINTKLDTLIERGEDHETRVRSLEKGRWIQSGVIAVITFVASMFSVRLNLG